MRRSSFATLIVVFLAACGGKPAQSPENAEESGDGGSSETASAGSDTSKSDAPSRSGGAAAPGDDQAKKKTPCAGFDITDLASVLSQTECEVGPPKEGAPQKDPKDVLEIQVHADSVKIAPGSTATITVLYKNKSKGDLALDFLVDPEPRFDFELYTPKGARAELPKGDEPSLPPEVSNAPVPEPRIARVTIATNGTARLVLKWNAVKYKWASKERAKGALPGHGYPKEPAGPLGKGKYVLRVVTPLANIAEGLDHEWSHPKADIEIGAQ
jgi:hypothetical protein